MAVAKRLGNLRIGFRVIPVKGRFFDSDFVKSKVDKATRDVLSKIGSFIWKRAKSSMKPPGKSAKTQISKPGKPPRYHTRLLKDKIFFSYEERTRSVVIGPIALNLKESGIPALLEEGGTVTRRKRKRAFKTRKGKRVFELQKAESVAFSYAARPYMGPAKEKELPKLPAMWRNSVRA